MKKSNEILIANLEAEMNRLGWDYSALAKETGLTRSGIYKIVKGQRWPSADNLDRIAKAFARAPGWLLIDHSIAEKMAHSPSPDEALEILREVVDRTTTVKLWTAADSGEKSELQRLAAENAELRRTLRQADQAVMAEARKILARKAKRSSS